MTNGNKSTTLEKVVALCKRRGFIFPGSEIYGGIEGIYDLGPLGVELANNLKAQWWKDIVQKRDNVVGLDSQILMNRQVWQVSGHEKSFSDPLVECKNCHERFREDILPKSKKCPSCGKSSWTKPHKFNLMFRTYIGPLEVEQGLLDLYKELNDIDLEEVLRLSGDISKKIEDVKTYLRPETAQGIFVNFKNVIDTVRVKLPFGIAQIGKGFRNEITTGNFLFRVREFEMMELEYFTYPKRAKADFKYWQEERIKWFVNLGIDKRNLRFREHKDTERAHYAAQSTDIEFNWPFMGWGELEGIANRTDYDLKVHSSASGEDLIYYDEKTKKAIVPYVIEPSVGVGRAILAFLISAYSEDENRLILKLHPKLAPYKVAVFPLLANKPALVKKARDIYSLLTTCHFLLPVAWDDRGNIGKRYFAQDEIGTPYCITIDFDTLKDNTVTIRDRNTTEQVRVKLSKLKEELKKRILN